MIFIKHVGKSLAELFLGQNDPLISENDPLFKVNGATGPPLRFSGMNAAKKFRFTWKLPGIMA
jgi:hypothetical protein